MFSEFEDIINYKFKNKELLKQAFTHSSFAHERKMSYLNNNERLEFLGDAVLEITISLYLYQKFPNMSEGELTKFRANIVCEGSLAKGATTINIGKYILLGKGEEQTGGRNRDSILSDVFEAIIGAVYLDGGNEKAKDFIIGTLEPQIEDMHNNYQISDYKTHLQEILQKESQDIIKYNIVNEEGPDHNKVFTAHVIHGVRILGEGKGKSKKEAEQKAASVALKNI